MDVRMPIGLLCAGIGLLLILAGFITPAAELKLEAIGFNLNLVWGAVMLAFGVGAMVLALRAEKHRD